MAQQRQGRRGEIQAIKAATETLAYFKFRFLKRPLIALNSVLQIFSMHARQAR